MSERPRTHAVEEGHDGSEVKGLARHTIGLVLLLCMVFTWTSGSFLNSAIFADNNYVKPFFIAYSNTMTFALLRIPAVVRAVYKSHRNGTLKRTMSSVCSRDTIKFFVRGEHAPNAPYCSERASLLRSDPKYGAPTVSCTDEDDDGYLDNLSTARYALMFSVLWLSANYFCTACLQYTTVASSMILGATSSLWALILGALTRTEKFSWFKLFGVCGSVLGIILISSSDLTSGSGDIGTDLDNEVKPLKWSSYVSYSSHLSTRGLIQYPEKTVAEIALGDFLALLSAAAYALYVVFLKKATLNMHPRDLHMPTFFGFMGLFNVILLFPCFPILHFTKVEHFSWPDTSQIWTLVVTLGLCNYLSDVFMAHAMVYTSPLLVTVALSMTIPVSLIGEMILRQEHKGWLYWIGAMVVVGSFVFVDREEVKDDQEIIEDHAQRSLETSLVLGRAHASVVSSPVDIRSANGNDDFSNGSSYSREEKRDGKLKEREKPANGTEDVRVDDIGYGSVLEISIDDIGSSGPSSVDRRYQPPGYR